MALRVTQIQTCDRCERPFKENYLKQGGNVPVLKRTGCAFVTTVTDSRNPEEPKTKVVFEFEDLCEACVKAMESLAEKMMLSSSSSKKAKRKTTKATEPSGGNGANKKKAASPKKAATTAKAKSNNGKKAAEPKTDDYEEPDPNSEASGDEESGEDLRVEDFGNDEGNLVEDPETGDIVNVDTGEVLQTREERTQAKGKGSGKSKGKTQTGAKSDAHPF